MQTVLKELFKLNLLPLLQIVEQLFQVPDHTRKHIQKSHLN